MRKAGKLLLTIALVLVMVCGISIASNESASALTFEEYYRTMTWQEDAPYFDNMEAFDTLFTSAPLDSERVYALQYANPGAMDNLFCTNRNNEGRILSDGIDREIEYMGPIEGFVDHSFPVSVAYAQEGGTIWHYIGERYVAYEHTSYPPVNMGWRFINVGTPEVYEGKSYYSYYIRVSPEEYLGLDGSNVVVTDFANATAFTIIPIENAKNYVIKVRGAEKILDCGYDYDKFQETLYVKDISLYDDIFNTFIDGGRYFIYMKRIDNSMFKSITLSAGGITSTITRENYSAGFKDGHILVFPDCDLGVANDTTPISISVEMGTPYRKATVIGTVTRGSIYSQNGKYTDASSGRTYDTVTVRVTQPDGSIRDYQVDIMARTHWSSSYTSTQPTCTEPGYDLVEICEICGKTIVSPYANRTSPLGHNFDYYNNATTTFFLSFNTDGSLTDVYSTSRCKRCDAESSKSRENFGNKKTQERTCTNGKPYMEYYELNKVFQQVGGTYVDDQLQGVGQVPYIINDSTLNKTIVVTAYEDAYTGHNTSFVGEIQWSTVDGEKVAEVEVKCSQCNETWKEKLTVESEIIQNQDCEHAEITKYKASYTDSNNSTISAEIEEKTKEALGHDWQAPTYTWAEDNSTCTATQLCANDAEGNHTKTETVETTLITTDPKCEEYGNNHYGAVFVTNAAFSSQSKDVPIGKLNHDYDWDTVTYTWAEDNSSCTATVQCRNFEDCIGTATDIDINVSREEEHDMIGTYYRAFFYGTMFGGTYKVEDIVIPYQLWVNGERFTEEKTTIECGDGTAAISVGEDGEYILTLDNATITDVASTMGYFQSKAAINCEHDLVIIVKGDNVIDLSDDDNYSDGILMDEDYALRIMGDGTLTIKDAPNDGIASYYGTIIEGVEISLEGCGISTEDILSVTNSDITIVDGCLDMRDEAEFTECTIAISSTEEEPEGIAIDIYDCILSFNETKLDLTNVGIGIYNMSDGAQDTEVYFNDGSEINIDATFLGIGVEGDVEIDGAKVNVTAGKIGIGANNLSIVDGEVNATVTDSEATSAIYVYNNLEIEGGTVVADSTPAENVPAIMANRIKVTGGRVEAESATVAIVASEDIDVVWDEEIIVPEKGKVIPLYALDQVADIDDRPGYSVTLLTIADADAEEVEVDEDGNPTNVAARAVIAPHEHEWVMDNDETQHWGECYCGDVYEREDHSYGEWTETVAPKCEEPGKKEHTCTVCEYVEETIVEAIGHDYDYDNTKYEWSDDHKKCTATVICKNDPSHTIVEVSTNITESDTSKDGIRAKKYVAKFEDENIKDAEDIVKATAPAKPGNVSTGDTMNITLYIILLLVAVAGIAGALVFVKKRN